MTTRAKRSVSIPPDVDRRIEMAAAAKGMTYSAWIVEVSEHQLKVEEGLEAVAHYEEEFGAFSAEELLEADRWARKVLRVDKEKAPSRRRK